MHRCDSALSYSQAGQPQGQIGAIGWFGAIGGGPPGPTTRNDRNRSLNLLGPPQTFC